MSIDDGYLDMQLLRFTTAGSVDDGKSTLIGRLLYDSKSIFEDQMEAVKRASINRGEENVNLALLTDGLRAEREQGITIDVAYRYFATPKRKFIIADTPGHVQYTRNMVTGASTANLATILIDARKGVIEQTKRHSYIASLLRIPHLVVCVNKMDLVDYSEDVFNQIKADFDILSAQLKVKDVHFIPISALKGDNVVDESKNMPWYKGNSFLHLLENIEIDTDRNLVDGRFPVQYVIRPMKDEFHDYRGYAGKVASGQFVPGQKVKVFPSGITTTVKAIDAHMGEIDHAFPPMAVTLRLDQEIDISRGDMIVEEGNEPHFGNQFEAMVCWMNEKKLVTGRKYHFKHTTKDVKAIVTHVNFTVNVNTMEHLENDLDVGLNDIACIGLKTTQPLCYDSYNDNRITGSFIIVDDATNETLASGMIR